MADAAAAISAEPAMLTDGNKDDLDDFEDDETVNDDNKLGCVTNVMLKCHNSICHLLNHQSYLKVSTRTLYSVADLEF